MDSIACWNVRGMNKANRHLDIKSFMISNKFYLVGLLETKVSFQHRDRVAKVFGAWNMSANYNTSSYGRIWVMWQAAKFHVMVIEQSSQLMHCEVLLIENSRKINVTYVYAFNHVDERVGLWEDLRRIASGVNLPWMIMGDFNTTLFYDERIRGGNIVDSDLRELTSFTEDVEVMDMKYSGQRLTWCNNQEGRDRMYCKLDRVLMNRDWFNSYPLAEATFLNRSSSDHCPSIVRFYDNTSQGKHIFRYCSFWATDESFLRLVQQAWSTEFQGTPMYVLVKKLGLVKRNLKGLHRTFYAKLSQRIEVKRAELVEMQIQAQNQPMDVALQQAERQLAVEYGQMLENESSLLKQKSRAEWINLGDQNTQYYHARVKENIARARINTVQDAAGNIITDPGLVSEVFLQFYNELLGTKEQNLLEVDMTLFDDGPTISEEQGYKLCNEVTMQEVKRALWSIPSSKSPGPDGFSSDFFKISWDIIKYNLCYAVQDFFRYGKLLKQVNATLLTLVPKVQNPTTAADYRPIACCNVVYKILTKIITARLQELLPSLVGAEQGAFIKQRSIVDNINVCQGLVRNYHRDKGVPRCLMKLDLRKAYDTIDWNFIRGVLKGFKFPEMIIDRIMECLTTPRFSILINGSPYGYFPSKRGLRQGDPMSPYLFVIAMDYLAKLFKKLHNRPAFKFHPKCKKLKLKLLSFADDIMCFCRGDAVSPLIMKEYITEFADTSGLRVNLQKSQVFFCGVNCQVKENLIDQLGFSEGKLPIKYLGLPLIASKLTIADCEPILQRIRTKVGSWSARMLSYAGRAVLIQSILFHYQVYWSNTFLLPKGVIHQMECLFRNYLWNGSSESKHMPVVAWDRITLPREEGGLGFLQMEIWNKAAFGKQLWKIIANKDCLWVDWAKEVYLKGNSIWEVKAKDSYPWTWRKLLQMRGMFKQHVIYNLGDGRQISLFYDNWLSIGPIKEIIGDNAMIWGGNFNVRVWWNDRDGWVLPNSFCRRHPVIAAEIQKYSISTRPDSVSWCSILKEYTVNSMYELSRKRGDRVNWGNIVWSTKALPRFKFCSWLLWQKSLKTKVMLLNRGVAVDLNCQLCLSHDEDCSHMFFGCSYSRTVWQGLLARIGICRNPICWEGEARWARRTANGRSARAMRIKKALACTVYYIWQERNLRIFQQKSRNLGALVEVIIQFL